MDPNSVLLSPQSRTCSHPAEPCLQGGESPASQDPARDSSFSWSHDPSSSLTDADWFWDEHIQAKRARVETIIQGMCLLPSRQVPASAQCRDSLSFLEKARERKRKQSLPMQQGPQKPGSARDQCNRKGLGDLGVREQLYLLKRQLENLEEHILHAAEERRDRPAEPGDPAPGPGTSEKGKGPLRVKQKSVQGSSPWMRGSDHQQGFSRELSMAQNLRVSEVKQQSEEAEVLPAGAEALLGLLKEELRSAVSQAVDSVLQKFNRCITSQMIKWFSNFREFYYIQMEKFARQAISEGVAEPNTLVVLRDSELFRALNMHYNKGNDFQVPDCFLEIASLTLQEFFRAVSAGKDSDPSWKKPIYKIISKLDSDIPEIFKSPSYP
ncbi:PREDICTED: prospero homeobox protein 2 isoform X2 [Elephantulus edwardii]|uniref:prospero homeobox protein 2 isoform X2 n=1 Tax=Elephantulus edwardii TaxID=28737 RepID=UPI0003F08509|nr:PREDICTED: prospero homeobox protein 2 isoform X2 [Elephantulus edwardii]